MNKNKTNRMRRVNQLLQRELGILCERRVVSELSSLLTITGVKTSPDLRHAQVFYSVLGESSDWAAAQAALDKHRVELQAALAQSVVLKYTPVLQFRPDPTLEQADRVFSIIESLDLDDLAEEDAEHEE